MQVPLQITYRNMESSEAVEENIRKWVNKLEKVSEEIISCHVVISAPQPHKQKGGHFHTRIDLTLPGREIVVNREPPAHHSYVDVYVSLRDAFENARRLLSEEVRQRQGEQKTHTSQPHGRIVALLPAKDFGNIETADGRELLFHRNSVLNVDFAGLKVGDEVRFEEQTDGEELRASSVRLIGKHHLD